MTGSSSTGNSSVNVDVSNHMLSKHLIMRRFDQPWALEAKCSDYKKEVSHVSIKSKVALSHLRYQELRLKDMQALLCLPLSIQMESMTDSNDSIRANGYASYHYRARDPIR